MAEVTAIELATAAWRRQGLSASQIGLQMGVSRNAVCGALYRARRKGVDLDFSADAVACPPAMTAKASVVEPASIVEAERPVPKPAVVAPEARAARAVDGRLAPERQSPPQLPPMGVGPAVLALRAEHCRWPIGDPSDARFRFCCARVEELHATGTKGSYCPEHRKAAIDRTPTIRRSRETVDG